ncbi:MAG: AMP-binding protein [Hyphomicrobiaceae bacterium]|nr:AMP-binding protein [Hyphomicrobiaceae bacterium]
MPSRAPSSELDTIPKLLLRNASRLAARPAYREKDLGIWQTWTWAQVRDEIRELAIGLYILGLKRGETVAIIGDNRPRLYWTFAAAQSIGAIPVPVYQDAVAAEMAYVLSHAEIALAVVENQEQVDKVLSLADQIPTLRRIVYEDPRGLKKYDHTRLHSFEEVQSLGRQELKTNPATDDWWHEEIAQGSGSDISVMLYTSGTTGQPKGVVLSHENLIRTAVNANAFDKLSEKEEIIAYLPMAWVGDHIFSYGQAFAAGFCVACPESLETAMEDRREIGPTFFFGPPRRFEAGLTDIVVRMQDASRLKRWMFDTFMRIARRSGEQILEGKPVPLSDRLLYWIGDKLVYAPLRNRLGLSRLKIGYTAGEAIGPEIFRFYRSLGINLKQLYGQTEATVYITMQPDGEIFADTVGPPAPDVDIRIADNGEVLFRGPGVFQHYHKNEAATAATKNADGWVHTGDAGFFDSRGHLVIIDRAKDVGHLNDGALLAPKYLENKLKFFPEVKEAVVFGDGRDFATMFINIDLVSVGNWAERNNVMYGSYQELAGHPEVYAMIERRVDEINAQLAQEPKMASSQIRRFLVLPKELDADDGELTRTQKVRRGFIADRYAPLIRALYDGSKECHIRTEVTFEDGRKGMIEADVRIVDMPTHQPMATALKEAAE